MSWSFKIKQRNKIALALGAIILITVLANWFVSYSMTVVGSQFKSVYVDRLVPALDISAIQERYYQNRLLLEEHISLMDRLQQETIRVQLSQNEQEIDSLVAKYSATQLTAKEQQDLQQYLKAEKELHLLKNKILLHSSAGEKHVASNLYKQQWLAAFQELMQPLHALSELQESVGQELYEDADRQMKSLKTLSYLVIALAVIFALLIGTLLQTSRKIKEVKYQKFHLN
ncbi:MCP four helix bundle domain-containing protein [Pontibacter rugosus]|uniref:MCP four helix bundle domain-containing protein n=1 Tax=Pontibacter rugosus TaxID=1745966 RepID=A0ABW3SUM7_9BACT